ncbi:hypothetical protein E4U54_002493 [Claviceps lovelessii]|nr:hypothetical protein E4U54_002493 [Claviceps lovelessii]
MNRFRNKKKGKDDVSIGGRPSMDAEPSGPFRMFGKKKTQDDDSKTELDLATALPSSDDFRTSLLMTGLSARFSMLREQDDPNSKLGKASDDSVLQPKRQSRLADFGGLGGGLHDIAEIESLGAPQAGRFDSYPSDDASSITGSVMSRAKPNEGNNLFGGRQKIYKLAAGSRAGMSGRALYDDDVAQSSFQRWRQAEKERNLAEAEQNGTTFEAESTLDYNKRRETSSTTSSTPSAARNSTAATSIASQPSSLKDTHAGMPMPGPERSVTRTRRLYEQGLNQDLHDQQSSALSRMDILSKQRPFGSRTPDQDRAIPSPTATTFGDRVVDRRTIISKASAPNLRSFSSASMHSSHPSPAESAMSKFPRADQKPALGSTPPLSPPVSETGEPSGLAIQLGDRAKSTAMVTAMGVFNRPPVHYDESRYTQRQRQLQQGRDVSASRNTMSPVPPSVRERSRSSSARRTMADRIGPQTPLPELPVQRELPGSTTLDDGDDGFANSKRPEVFAVTPQLTIERPDDQDHPAFRKSPIPTPLVLNSPKSSDGQASPTPADNVAPPEDSPTLGPNGGLSVSGMIRHHLRNCSGASSMYGGTNQETETGADAGAGTGTEIGTGIGTETGTEVDNTSSNRSGESNSGEGEHGDRDEFAQHLADGARRVRERLTTYVESDNDLSAPSTPPQSEQNKDFFHSSRSVGPLVPKPSRGLFDRGEKERGRAMGLKTSGSQHGTVAATPSSRNTSSSRGPSRSRAGTVDHGEMVAALPGENIPGGLKAFRQARRELQKMKELEVQHRHGAPRSSHSQERPPNNRLPSYENGPPPALFNRMPRGDDQTYGSRARAASRGASEPDRSGPETSNGGINYSRGGPRPRKNSVTYEEHFGRPGGNGVVGPDVQRSGSPYMGNGVPPALAMNPNPGFGGRCEPNGRYFAPNMQGSGPPLDPPHYSRSRKGSLIGTAVSTPNLHGSAAAPPLPPINPRRKNGMVRSSEESSEGTFPVNSFGMTDGHGADDDLAGDQFRRATIAANGHIRHGPPMGVRPPIPHSQMSSTSLQGRMI